MSHRSERAEVLVIGAGPGGATIATRLAEAGRDVLLIDRAQFPRDKTCGDGLTPRCIAALEQAGMLEAVLAAGATKITGLKVVGPYGQEAQLMFDQFLDKHPPYGLTLERFTLDEVLLQHAIARGVRFLDRLKISDFTLDGNHITATHGTREGEALSIVADVVILATGASNTLLRRLGIMDKMPRTVRAARAYFEGVNEPEPLFSFYFKQFLMPGYAWIFPLGNGRVNAGAGLWPMPLVHRGKPALPHLLERFANEQSANGNQWRRDGPVKGYPIRTDFPSHRLFGDNWLIIGEAAGLVSPATGEGIDLAIESGLLAADMLIDWLAEGKWRGRAYQRRIWYKFAPLFSGTRVYSFLIINPVMFDYAVWQLRNHHFLAKSTVKLAMGLTPPWITIHPLFLLQFFLPLPTST